MLESVNCDRTLFSSCMPFSRAIQREKIKPITSTPSNIIGMQVGIQNPLGCIVFLLFKFWCQTENEKEREREKLRKRKRRRIERNNYK